MSLTASAAGLVAYAGPCWRAVATGCEAAVLEGSTRAGRYNRPDERTLYTSGSPEGVAAALKRYGEAPRTVVRLAVEADALLDLRDAAGCAALGIDAAAARADWQAALAGGEKPPSWQVSDRARALGADGLIDASRRAPGLWHLVLFRWDARSVRVAAPYDAATLAFYTAEAPAYAARRLAPSPALSPFLALLPAGGRVLELGCGGGQDAAAMLAAGYAVDATDGCPAMAAEAAARLGRPVRTLRFDELAAVAAYDGVWAAACLLHVPRDELAGVLARIWRALKPGGIFAASFKTGAAEGRDRLGRWYNRFAREELMALYAGWEVLAVEERDGAGYDGAASGWVGMMVRRP